MGILVNRRRNAIYFITSLCLGLIITLSPTPFSLASVSRQDFPDVCQEPGNILPNCNFDEGMAHWQTFLEDGHADFTVLSGGGECHAPLCPALYIVSESYFIGGVYQQVPVTPGNSYYANIVWLVFDSLVNDASVYEATGGVGRRIGIDPFGGTDPASPNIVWSVDNWRNDCKICNVEEVTVTAQAETITVFLRLENTWRRKAGEKGFQVPPSQDKFWIDDIGLKQVGEGPAPAVAAIEPTESPPTDTPPTDTPSPPPPPTATLTATTMITGPTTTAPITETVAITETPTLTPTETTAPPPTIASPPTLTPSPTRPPTDTPPPLPTRPPRPTPAPPQAAVLTPRVASALGITVCAGVGLLGMMGAIVAGLVWLYQLGRDPLPDEEEFFDDDQESVP